eukprot:748014-Hanusia_phi.AAC.1
MLLQESWGQPKRVVYGTFCLDVTRNDQILVLAQHLRETSQSTSRSPIAPAGSRQQGNLPSRLSTRENLVLLEGESNGFVEQTHGRSGSRLISSTSSKSDTTNSLEDLHHAASLLLLTRDRCLKQQSSAK